MRFPQRVLVVALVFAGVCPAASTARSIAVQRPKPCSHVYTLREFESAAKAVYLRPLPVPKGTYNTLWLLEKCQRRAWNRPKARAFWSTQITARGLRRHPFSTALASWYVDDQSETASGWRAEYGIANLTMPFGTRVDLCYPAGSEHCVVATVDDRGPAVWTGRFFDLDQTVAAELGFSGVGEVSWRIE